MNLFVVAVLAACAAIVSVTEASPNVVADARIRDPNRTPVLGRGYSLTTYDVLSTCLNFKEKSQATYNYDYSLMEFTSDGKSSTDASGSFEASISWGFISASVSGSFKSKTERQTHKHHIVTKMAMERYYSSLVDTTATLTPDAKALLDRGDTVGFFQGCGSGYIRSIRRTAEITAIFTIESASETSTKEMAGSLRVSIFGRGAGGGSFSSSSTSFSQESTLTITIKAFGLGLNMEGADTLVARSLEDYDKVLKFAFKSMQNDEVGMIHGIEVVNWANNLQFQNAIRFEPTERVEFDDCSAIFPAGTTIATGTTPAPGAGGANPPPADGSAAAGGAAAAAAAPPKGQCRKPSSIMQPIEIKAVTMINAEFITAIESYYREQLNYVFKLRTCIGEFDVMRKMKSRIGTRTLIDHSTMDFDVRKPTTPTFNEIEAFFVTDALQKKYMATKNFIQGFYGPCVSAITRTSNNGRMTRYWFEFPECSASCLRPGYELVSPGSPNYDAAKAEFDKANPKGPMLGATKDMVCAPSQQDAVKADSISLTISLDGAIDKYCMPELQPA